MGPVGMKVKREGLTEKGQVPKSPTPPRQKGARTGNPLGMEPFTLTWDPYHGPRIYRVRATDTWNGLMGGLSGVSVV